MGLGIRFHESRMTRPAGHGYTASPTMQGNRLALYWHSFFLAVTVSFTEVNTVMPALILEAGGGEGTVGILTGIMRGLPLISQLLFASFLHSRDLKKPFLLLGINLRVVALAAAAAGIAFIGTDQAIIPVVFITMSVFSLSGAFAGVSYTEIMGKVVEMAHRRTFFVNRQTATALGLLVSAVATRLFLGTTSFPHGYVLLFIMASGFLLVASGGFWVLREPAGRALNASRDAAASAGRPGFLEALKEVPGIISSDTNMRALIVAVNLGALGFTAIPLITARAHAAYDLMPAAVGSFVLVQVAGMLVANWVWSRTIRRGGFRLVLRAELILIALLFPLSLLAAQYAPLWAYTGIYFLVGSVLSAHKLGVEAILVQISPNARRALYAGVFGAANLGTALMPPATGALARSVGFTAVFAGAALLALLALVPAGRIDCGEWYKAESEPN